MIRSLLLLTTLGNEQAGAFDLAFPVACTLGQDCFIQQYMDRDAGPGATDFTCGSLSYDTHSGTDFALLTEADMARDVTVLAAAPGRVKGVRDGMPDIRPSAPGAAPLNGRDCGNGVVIDHGNGWETQYCHMKSGSVTATEGQEVTVGTPLGSVGMSGNAEFPHLHLSVRQNGAPVDPFDPADATCGPAPEADLWAIDLPYQPGGIVTLGLATEVPAFDALKTGQPPAPPTRTAPAMVLWAQYFGNRAGDALTLTLTGPEGEVISQTEALDRTQARAFRAVGRRLRGADWPAGTYTGLAVLTRNGAEVDVATIELRLD